MFRNGSKSSLVQALRMAGVCTLLWSCAAQVHARSIYQSAELALANHPEVARQRAQQQVVRAEEVRTGADYLPKVRLSMGVGREDSNTLSTRSRPGGSSIELERREAGVNVQQMLFDGFRTRWQTAGAEAATQAQDWQRRNVLGEIALRAIEAHLALLDARHSRALHQQHVAALSGVLNDIESRIRSGKDEPARRSQAMARLSRALAGMNQAETQLTVAQADYVHWVGEEPDAELDASRLLSLSLPEEREQFLAQVRENNPKLMAQQAALRAAQSQRQAESYADYPYVFVETGANWDANVDGTPGRNSDAYIMLRLNYDLYSGGRYRAQEDKARFQAEAREYELDALTREVTRDALQSWQESVGLSAQLAAFNDASRFTEETRQAYYKQFSIGQRRLLDLLDIENEWLDAQLQSLHTSTEYEKVRFRLLWLSGALLANLAEHGQFQP